MPSPQFLPPADEAPASSAETRCELLASTKRGFTPVRHIFVQLPRDDKKPRAPRGSVLGVLVSSHQERALDAYLLVLALEPILGDHDPLHSAVWGRLMSDTGMQVGSVSRTWKQLVDRKLITKVRRSGHALVRPRREDGKAPYRRPGRATRDDTGGWPRGDWYFAIPHAYWLDGWDQKLSLPGKAMLMIALKETGTSPSFWMRHEDARPWYGISADTAQRGLAELARDGLVQVFYQKIMAPKSPTGFTTRDHYTLRGAFSTEARRAVQARARAEAKRAESRKVTATKATSTKAGARATVGKVGGSRVARPAAVTAIEPTVGRKVTATRKTASRKRAVEQERG